MYLKKINLFKLITSTALLLFGFLPLLAYAETSANVIIENPGLETKSLSDASLPEHWNQGFWGTNSAVFTYPAPGADGTSGVKVEISAYENGDAKWFFDEIPVRSGEQYVFSDSYLASVPADIVARYTLLDGNYRYAYLGTSVISPEWTGYSTLPFTVPTNTASLTIFHLIRETGSLFIDNLSLHQLAAPQEVPLKVFPNLTISAANGGGIVPLSFLSTPLLPKEQPVTPVIIPQKTPPLPSLVDTLEGAAKAAHQIGALTYTRTAEAKTANDNPEASIMPPALYSIKNISDFSETPTDFTLVFSGLSLILFSIGLTLILIFQNTKDGRRESLWRP